MLGAEVKDVVQPGVTPQCRSSQQAREIEIPENLSRLGVKRPYLLSVATPETRKNLDAVLRAYIDLKRGGKLSEHQLVLAGPTGWKDRGLKQRLRDARVHGMVLAGDVSTEVLPTLYAWLDAIPFSSFFPRLGKP